MSMDNTADETLPKPGSKARSPRRLELQKANNKGQCPARSCEHPPVDHRPVAGTKDHFCYAKKCMAVCHHG